MTAIGPLQHVSIAALVVMTLAGLYFTSQGEEIPPLVNYGFLATIALVALAGFQFLKEDSSVPEEEQGPDVFELKEAKKQDRYKKKQQAAYEKASAKQAEIEQKKQEKVAHDKALKAEAKAAKLAAEQAAAEAKAAAAAAFAAANPAADPADKKKKKKKKNKAGEPAKPPAAAAAAAPAEELKVETKTATPESEGWTLKPIKKISKKGSEGPTITSEMMVNPRHFAAIAGHEGHNKIRIEENFGVRVNIPKKGSPSEVIKFEGTYAAIDSAKAVINEIIDKGYSNSLDSNMADSTLTISNLSLLVGVNGANIKAIRQKTGARITLPEKDASGKKSDKDAQITILGDADAVKAASQAINQLMKEGFSDLTHENFQKINVSFPFWMKGILIGPKGAGLQKIQKATATRIEIPRHEEGDKPTLMDITIVGSAEGVESARRMITAIQTDFVSAELDIPAAFLGLLKGFQGTNIKELQKKTNTRVDIVDHLWDPSQKTLNVQGFDKDIRSLEVEVNSMIANNTAWVMDFPADRLGLLMKDKAAKLNALQDESGAKISVVPHEWDTTVKEVSVVGSVSAVMSAKAELERIATPPPKKEKKVEESKDMDQVEDEAS